MRMPERKNFADISRQSIQKDFQQHKSFPEHKTKKQGIRCVKIHPNCMYAKEARFFVGKLLKLVESKGDGSTSGWYAFVFDQDKKAINEANGWQAKDKYLLTRPEFKHEKKNQ